MTTYIDFYRDCLIVVVKSGNLPSKIDMTYFIQKNFPVRIIVLPVKVLILPVKNVRCYHMDSSSFPTQSYFFYSESTGGYETINGWFTTGRP